MVTGFLLMSLQSCPGPQKYSVTFHHQRWKTQDRQCKKAPVGYSLTQRQHGAVLGRTAFAHNLHLAPGQILVSRATMEGDRRTRKPLSGASVEQVEANLWDKKSSGLFWKGSNWVCLIWSKTKVTLRNPRDTLYNVFGEHWKNRKTIQIIVFDYLTNMSGSLSSKKQNLDIIKKKIM
jgi:hypothetical protein